MKCRDLGNIGLKVSEIGLGAEWLEWYNVEEVKAIIDCCGKQGINILNCWMSEPNVYPSINAVLEGRRDKWITQGRPGSAWQGDQYVHTRELSQVKAAFMDLLERLRTDCIDLGMIHFVDEPEEFHHIMDRGFIGYVRELKENGVIRHIGMNTHNPTIAKLVALSGKIEMILFSVNPAFGTLPAVNDLNKYLGGAYDESLGGIVPEREGLYRVCEQRGAGITVMKGYAGGCLSSTQVSPFGVALTPARCLHYALTRPAVISTTVGYNTPGHVMEVVTCETASEGEKDYASILANAPHHAYSGRCTYCGRCALCPSDINIAVMNKLYDLAVMQKEAPAIVRARYASLSANADGYIDCQDRESCCPFGVPMAERMEKARKLFGEK